MSIRTLLAAALVAGSFAAPVLAADGQGSAPAQNAIEFYQSGQSQRLIEGRNSDRVVIEGSKASAAINQGFAVVDTDASSRGANN